MGADLGLQRRTSGCNRRLAATHGEYRSPSEAGEDIDDIQNKAERDCFLCRNAKGNKKKNKCALSNSQTCDADWEDLEDENGWIEREECGQAEPTET